MSSTVCEQVRLGPEPVNKLVVQRLNEGHCAQRLCGASCCMQLVHDSSAETAQVNTAVVRGQKTENCETHSETLPLLEDQRTTGCVIISVCL